MKHLLPPALILLLLLPAAVTEPPDGSVRAVWVYFADRGRDADQLALDLEQAAASLSERTRQRRARLLAPGAAVVDARDLPPAASYVDGVLATGVRLRNRSRWFNAVSVDATAAQERVLGQLPYVARIVPVVGFRRSPPPLTGADEAAALAARRERAARAVGDEVNYGPSLAGLEQINVPAVHAMGLTGAGVVIGLLDTGFLTTHEALAQVTVLATHDFLNDDDVVADEPGDPPNQHDHGTQALSAAAGYLDNELVGPAYGASVILAKTEDRSAEYPLEEDYWVAGLEWVEQQGADIVSSSLGYSDWYDFPDLDGDTAVVTVAADLAVGRGLVVVNSAGNERGPGTNHIIAPADGDSVIAVGAVDLTGAVAGFSSPGPTWDGRIKPDVAAQGVAVHVVALTDDTSYTNVSGTSFSCPLTSGVAALVLQRAPNLTPLQVREALRQTASRADQPDNDLGWGVLDALGAVTYWGATIVHDPLPDTEETDGLYTVSCEITDRLPLDPARMAMQWRADQGLWQAVPLVLVGGDTWEAAIPAQPAGVAVDYFLEVTDSADIHTRLPLAGPDHPFTFTVGPDTTPPVIVHAPLGDQPPATWPPLVAAEVTDNLGVDLVELTFAVNGGPDQGPFALLGASSVYELPLPLEWEAVAPGDSVTYTLTARDLAGVPNSTTSGPHAFDVVATLGVVLVIDDSDAAAALDHKTGADKQALPVRSGQSSAATAMSWLAATGYTVDMVDADAVGADTFAGYDLVILAAGNSTSPLAAADLRAALVARASDGGRLLLEGGELAYDALDSPGYPELAEAVLHVSAWRGDGAGLLQRPADLDWHPLLERPHTLPASIPVDYAGYGDQDAVDPAADALVVMDTAAYPGSAGVLVYDDTAAVESGQIVFFTFSLAALDSTLARSLMANAAAYLLADEPPPTAVIRGRVTMADGTDPAGVTVAVADRSVVTGPDGHFELAQLHAGAYTVTAVREDYATVRRDLELADGEIRGGLRFDLRPALAIRRVAAPFVDIPDDDALGVTSVIDVSTGGELTWVDVDIDLRHTWIGDLTVRLTSPAGTTVTLHDRSGGTGDDLVGNWPRTLAVDGPGSLDDFLGEDAAGPWTLFVSDTGAGDTGTLRLWGLNLVFPAPPTGVASPPAATRLLGARPNPCNPRTTVVFDLARPGPVQLALFDARGRLVRRLMAGDLPAGRHEVRWDGVDQAGRPVASGLYLCRLEAAGVRELRKLMLVR